MRGYTTHGYGSMKKNRGAGHRGGRGNAGTGKRGDAKKPSIWKNKKYFGKYGFKTKSSIIDKSSINIKSLDDNLDGWIKKGLVLEKDGKITVNLTILNYDKLLSAGKVTRKYDIIVAEASKKAIEKIDAAGGKVLISCKEVCSASAATSDAEKNMVKAAKKNMAKDVEKNMTKDVEKNTTKNQDKKIEPKRNEGDGQV